MKNSAGKEDELLVFHIEPSYDSIITLKDESVFLRVNDKSKKLSHTQITQLEYDRGSRKFEEELVDYSSIGYCGRFLPPGGADIILDNYKSGECPCTFTKKE